MGRNRNYSTNPWPVPKILSLPSRRRPAQSSQRFYAKRAQGGKKQGFPPILFPRSRLLLPFSSFPKSFAFLARTYGGTVARDFLFLVGFRWPVGLRCYSTDLRLEKVLEETTSDQDSI